jgi:hypothetical protein
VGLTGRCGCQWQATSHHSPVVLVKSWAAVLYDAFFLILWLPHVTCHTVPLYNRTCHHHCIGRCSVPDSESCSRPPLRPPPPPPSPPEPPIMGHMSVSTVMSRYEYTSTLARAHARARHVSKTDAALSLLWPFWPTVY